MSVYNENKLRRKKNIYRIRLGFLILLNNPMLNVVWIPVILMIIIFDNLKNIYISSLNVPKILSSVLYIYYNNSDYLKKAQKYGQITG